MQPINPEDILNKLKSQSEPSPEFRQNLRNRILVLARENQTERKSIMTRLFDKKAIGGLATMIAVLALAVFVQTNYSNNARLSERELGKLAFGQLPAMTQGGGRGAGGGGGGAAEAMSSKMANGDASASDMTVAPRYEEWLPPIVTYNVDVELPEIAPEMYVYREAGLFADKSFMKFLGNATQLELIKRHTSAIIENISIAIPNSPFRYNLDQSGRFGMWSGVPEDWSKPAQEVPDEEVIAIANNFLESQGINREMYGQPYVENSWRIYYAREKAIAGDAANIMPPSQVTVYYPSTLDGLRTVNWSGTDDPGLMVGVSLISKNVNNVNGRWQSNREKSLYPASDQKAVMEQAKAGGLSPLWGWTDQKFTAEQQARRQKITVNVDKVEIGYLQQYKYNESNGTTQIFWVPVYAFTGNYVDETGTTMPYGTIVPAIDGNFFEQNNPRPMPVDIPPTPVEEPKPEPTEPAPSEPAPTEPGQTEPAPAQDAPLGSPEARSFRP